MQLLLKEINLWLITFVYGAGGIPMVKQPNRG